MAEPISPGNSGMKSGKKDTPDTFQNFEASALFYSGENNGTEKPITDEAQKSETRQLDADAVETTQFTEVMFKGGRRGYFLNETGMKLTLCQHVVVEAEKGFDLGVITGIGDTAYLKNKLRVKPSDESVRKIIRIADEEDLKAMESHREEECCAFRSCIEKIQKLNLPMKLVDVEFQLDRNRITFYFTADGRVDFRELVRELAAEYKTRIELRQIGPRDEAKRLGGYGICGRELCCSSWLGAFEPISTEMARLQNLTLNPFKLAGQCGRLKCCLAYEMKVYEDLLKRFPPLDLTFKTEKGIAKIEKIDVFQDMLYVHYETSDAWDQLTRDQVLSYLDKNSGK